MSKDDDVFNELVSNMQDVWQLRKVRATLGAVIHSSCFLQMMIETFDDNEDFELEDMMIKALDSIQSSCELFISMAEDWEERDWEDDFPDDDDDDKDTEDD